MSETPTEDSSFKQTVGQGGGGGGGNCGPPMLKSVDVDDEADWGSLRDASFMLNREPREIQTLCEQGHIRYQVRHPEPPRIHIPSVIEYLSRTLRLGHRQNPDRPVSYSELLTAILRTERKIDTVLEGIQRMTAADSQIEADVASLKATFSAVSDLVATLQALNATLQQQAANNQAPSAQTLSDLDDVTNQFSTLVPATPPADGGGDTPPVDTPPVDTPPVDTPPVDTTSPGDTGTGTPPVDGGVDPTSGGATVGDGGDTPPATPASPQSP